MSERQVGSRTLDRGITVAEAVAAAGDGATVAELSRFTSFDRAVVHRLLTTLVARGWVTLDASGNRYHPGVALSGLSVPNSD